MNKTTKRVKTSSQKIVGNQNYINADTGEIIETVVIEKKVGTDVNWHKVWINDLMGIMNLIGGKKLKVFNYLLSIMRTSDNTLNATYNQIIKDTEVSRQTVADTMKILQDTNFIKKLGQGYWMISPAVIAKGNSNKRQNLLIKYTKE